MDNWWKVCYLAILGIIVGILYASIGILLVYRTGMGISASLVTPLLLYFMMRILFKPKSTDLMLVQSISSGASLATFSLESAFAAAIIFGSAGLVVTLWHLIGLGIAMNLLGILVAMPLIKMWIHNENLPFPKGQAIGKMIVSFTNGKKSDALQMLWSGILAIIIYLATQAKKGLINPVSSFIKVPSFIGVELSPLLFGLGMFLPFKVAKLLLLGAVYSFFIWMTKGRMESAITFQEHLFQPLVFSVAIGLALGQTLYSIPGLFVKMKDVFKNIPKAQAKVSNLWFIIFLLTIVLLSIFLNNALSFPYHGVPVIIFIAIVFGLLTARTRGESGLGTTATIYLTIPIVAIFTKDLTTVLLLAGAITLMTVTVSDCLEMSRIGVITKTPINKILIFYAIGSVAGVVAGSLTMYTLQTTYGLGSGMLPVPISLAWGTVASAVVGQGLHESINVSLISLSILTSIILSHYKKSPLLVGMGIFVPASVVLPIFLGGFMAHSLIRKNSRYIPHNLGAGLVTGEGLMILCSGVLSLFW